MAEMRIQVSTEGALFNGGARATIVTEELRAYLTKASKAVEAEVAKRIPVNTGVTRGALFSAVRGVSVARGEAVVSLPVEHAEALEMGTRPHWPPRAPIELWVRQRFRDKGGSIRAAVKSTGQSEAAAIRSIAFLVARKIARRGTRAIKMFQLAQQSLVPFLTEGLWSVTLNKIAGRLSDT